VARDREGSRVQGEISPDSQGSTTGNLQRVNRWEGNGDPERHLKKEGWVRRRSKADSRFINVEGRRKKAIGVFFINALLLIGDSAGGKNGKIRQRSGPRQAWAHLLRVPREGVWFGGGGLGWGKA